MDIKEKNHKIERAIKIVWTSLSSHLPYTYVEPEAYAKKRGETKNFHKNTIKEYAEVISTLCDLL